MSNASRLTLLLAMLVPGLAQAQDAVAEAEADAGTAAPAMVVESLSGRIPEEVTAFEETWARFQSRTKAYESETRDHLAAREAEERAELSEGYDQLITTLEGMERDQRELTIERFEEFLRKYPNSPDGSHVRFRLAELYFEKSKEDYFDQMAAFSEAEAAIDYESEDVEDQLAELGEPPMQDLSRNIALYERIVSDNLKLPEEERYEFLAGTFLMLGFSYYDPNSAQNDERKAIEAYRALIEHVPGSEYVDRAHLFIGNHHFDYNEVDEAVSHYNEVLKKGPEGKFYGEALYQLAWSYYKLSYYDEALETFVKLLDYSEDEYNDTGRRSEFQPEALRYMAISFADIADNETMEASVGKWHSGLTSPVAVARAYFQKVGNRDYEWDIFRDMGEVLTQQARYDQGIEVYTALQEDPRWRLKPENPTFQWQVIKLHGSGTFADPVAQSRAQTMLTDRYNDRSEWWQANRSNAEALNKARGYIEQSLVNVGIEYRQKASETGTPEDWDQAVGKFREYLEKFPIADDFYQVQFYLAVTLLDSQRFDEADAELEQLIKVGPVHPYLDMAIVQQFTVRRQALVNTYGTFDKLYDGAQVEKSYETDFGREVTVYQLSEDHTNFLVSIDRIIEHEFTEPDDPSNDVRQFVTDNEHAITYIAGQIYYVHNQYEKAREYLQKVIDRNRATEEANFAAKLLVDMANTEGNLALSRKLLSEFARNPPGVPENIAVDDAFFGDQLEAVAFKQCFALVSDDLDEDAKDRGGAAECFLQFMDDFPESQYLSVALYNAANNYEAIGKAERANQLFERYVNEYPDDPLSKGLYWRIASNYESTFELDEAIRYYEGLVTNFPDFEDSPGALYNAAFLRIGLRDFEGAAKTFERYAKNYPDLPDVEEMVYRAAEQYENADADKGFRAYERYLKSYRGENADRTLEAAYKVAKYWQDKGNERRYLRAMDEVLAIYDELLAAGEKVGRNGTNYAAIGAFPAVQEAFDKFTAFELSGNENKDIPVLVQEKPEELAAFENEVAAPFIAKYPDFEYVTAAYYLIAEAYQWYANTGLAIQCPESMSMEECDIFYEILDTEVFPLFYNVQDKAIARYEKMISFGKEKRQYSQWIEKAQEALNKIDPRTFPAVKAEVRGGTDSSVFPEIKPKTMDDPAESGDEEGN